MNRRFFLLTAGVFFFIHQCLAQSYVFEARVYNLPFNKVAMGYMQGEKFILCDTLDTSNSAIAGIPAKLISWTFPPDAGPGMYRIVFGQTTYARVMDEPPQQLDFIFNGEDIKLQTHFKAPVDSLKIIASEENRVWFSFLKKEAEYRQRLDELEMEVNYYQDKLSDSTADLQDKTLHDTGKKATSVTNRYNLLQMERENFVANAAEEHAGRFASQLIKTCREPLKDGYLSKSERVASWQDEYFRFIDFSDEAVIKTPVFTDKIFNYLVTYNRQEFTKAQREAAYIQAVDEIMTAVKKNAANQDPVYEFILDYLVDGFERLNMTKVLAWISEKYAGALCTTDEKTTLLRKLEAQKMIAGAVVPDFTLNNMNGQPVTFSEVPKKRNLIIFWASWCPHCSSLWQGIKALSGRNPDLEVFAISLDHSKSEWQKAVTDAGIEHFRNLSDLKEWDGKTARDYNIYATPTLFLVDNKQTIIARPASIEELSGFLAGY
ncbi:MAG: TlpA family protein disulfide reductase [Mariniphaga sp.]